MRRRKSEYDSDLVGVQPLLRALRDRTPRLMVVQHNVNVPQRRPVGDTVHVTLDAAGVCGRVFFQRFLDEHEDRLLQSWVEGLGRPPRTYLFGETSTRHDFTKDTARCGTLEGYGATEACAAEMTPGGMALQEALGERLNALVSCLRCLPSTGHVSPSTLSSVAAGVRWQNAPVRPSSSVG